MKRKPSCVFYKNDAAPITIRINLCDVQSKKVVYVLGVLFDAKLTQTTQVEHFISKSTRALNTLKVKKKIFQLEKINQHSNE
jgi:hypothetical protein